MAKKGNLFLLIKSLSKAEKRYIRLFAGNRREAVYLQLFDAIEAQEEYDEAAIRRRFKGKAFLRQLHVSKIYLTELILKALKNYSAKNSVHSELLNLLVDIELLFSRELYDLCHYRIEKAEKLARRYEKQALLCEVLAWKRKLLLIHYHSGANNAIQATAHELEAINALEAQQRYWEYTLTIFKYRQAGKDLLSTPFFERDEKARTMQAKLLRLHIIYSLQYMRGHVKEAEQAATALIDYLESLPHRIADDPAPYAAAISNKIGLLLRAKRWEEVAALIKKIKEMPLRYDLPRGNKFTIRLWLRVYNLELEMYRDSGQHAKGIPLIAEITDFMKLHQKSIPADYVLLLYYQFAYLHFLGKQYAQALKWTNASINLNFDDLRTDIQAYTRILNLLLHVELDNTIVLRYAVDACRRFLKKNKLLHAYEETVLIMFSKLGRGLKQDYKTIFKEAYKALFDTSSPRKESQLDYINLKAWLQEKTAAGTNKNLR